MTLAIELHHLSKSFRVRRTDGGLRGAVRSIVFPRTDFVRGVEDLSFSISSGERVSFIGPNGAGKSTTLKMLSGILHPSSGEARVLGRVPWQDRHALGYEIATVFGQRSRLWLHLPARDTFDLLARIYDLKPAAYRQRRDELVATFGVEDLVRKPVRQLSLGERTRCELVASMLHNPSVLFLDEPTIGLDVVAKATLRDLVRRRAEQDGSTVVLTSHDTGDMEAVCDRVLVIHRGRLILDRPLATLRRDYLGRKLVTLVTAEEYLEFSSHGVAVVDRSPHRTVLSVDTSQVRVEQVVQAVLSEAAVQDINVEDPPMDELIRSIYADAGLGAAQ